ncbi:DRMBL-domain-containing protein [Sarocladium strictum]
MVASTKTKRHTTTPRKPALGATQPKSNAKPNASILSFFKKTDKPEEAIFVGPAADVPLPADDELYNADDVVRFNEIESPVKKRKVDIDAVATAEPDKLPQPDVTLPSATKSTAPIRARRPKRSGPFVESDSESDEDDSSPDQADSSKEEISAATSPRLPSEEEEKPMLLVKERSSPQPKEQSPPEVLENPIVPSLKHEESSFAQMSDLEHYGDLDELDMDTFEGEETREMRFMREQARLEAEEAGQLEDFHDEPFDTSSLIQSCPICDGYLSGISADDASRHVNACLDGNPTPLPKKEAAISPKRERSPKLERADTPEVDSVEVSKRFARAAVPRPGQANPFAVAEAAKSKTSAFSKLMSGNVEDTAWATAAAAENAARGRPAYERTCPFYKIMPNFNICVDAFRYGAVKDCNAYFLSHFHSDHYIGLTASWRHGPIYCSKVTGSLVKNQLRTAAKWVVELEWDEPTEVPGTGGATVTMIPANHCPGSSLFLFEKTMTNGVARRILHCGDFRACPAHIAHPLLKPDLVDSISGKVKHQKIDQCYLDTTYLNPRYSFPPQDDVIKATADLCASISPDPDCKDDVWESASKEAGNQTVSKFFPSDRQAPAPAPNPFGLKTPKQRLLVVCGTYSIGKERICIAIAKALGSKIFASPGKIKICRQLDNPELAALLTTDPREAQVHMQMLMEIRAETLQEYLNGYKPHFSRIVGFRPSGWTFRPSNGKTVGANTPPGSIPMQQILHGNGWRTRFGYKDFIAQRGSTKEAMCFGVPYSEHSSFRELSLFVMSLRIEKVIPTVNVGSEPSRKRMKAWIDRWQAERRRGGLVIPLIEGKDEEDKMELWDGKAGTSGGVWW